jgi:hypothetical protein
MAAIPVGDNIWKDDDGFWFSDEAWAFNGPFPTKPAAQDALDDYCTRYLQSEIAPHAVLSSLFKETIESRYEPSATRVSKSTDADTTSVPASGSSMSDTDGDGS